MCIFIIGSPRSGTTLLQALLDLHPIYKGLPETHYFIQYRNPLKRKAQLDKFNNAISHPYRYTYFELLSTYLLNSQNFITHLDFLAKKDHKKYWIEKTPDHLFSIDKIERISGDFTFIHLVRKGIDVVASLHAISKSYSEPWAKIFQDINQCITTWNLAMNEHIKYIDKAKHIFVNYDNLASQPLRSINSIFNLLGQQPLSNIPDKISISHLIKSDEPWKSKEIQKINQRTKVNSVFGQKQITEIYNLLSNDKYEILNENIVNRLS